MQYLNDDGSKKFPFRLDNLSGTGLKQYFEERRIVAFESTSSSATAFDWNQYYASFKNEKDLLVSDCVGGEGRDEEDQRSFVSSLEINESADFILYYVRFRYNNRAFYKIGVTTTTLQSRFGDSYRKIDKVLFAERVVGALKVERSVLDGFQEHLFPLGIIKGSSGYTEFFDRDVLGLDSLETE